MSKVLGVGMVMFIAVIALGFFMWRNLYIAPRSLQETDKPVVPALIPEVEAKIQTKLDGALAIADLPAVRAAVEAANTTNAQLTYVNIQELDRAWRADANYPTAKVLMENDAALALRAFQIKCPELSEIFVTDKYGLNIGQTNKTSDYYQADEGWWTEAYADGKGKTYHGVIEFDQSSQKEGIALYFPIRGADGSAIGVVKAILDLSYLKSPGAPTP